MEALDYARSVFWNEYFWLPPNRTWADVQNPPNAPPDQRYPNSMDLLAVIPIAFLLSCIRTLLRVKVFQPIGIKCGLRDTRIIRPEPCEELEVQFKKERRPDHRLVQALSLQLSWPTRRIERWFRLKRNQQKATVLKKFCEGGWRFVFYTCIHIYGVYVLYDEDFIWNINRTVSPVYWPLVYAKSEFYWYYMLELGFYTSLLISLMWDVHRRDFFVQVVHHVLTIGLMLYSWTASFIAIGMLILLIHDVADLWLECAKLFKYIKYEKTAYTLFVIFFLIWMVSRMYILPVHMTLVCWQELWGHLWPSILAMLLFLSSLQVLHTIWTVFILKAIYSIMTAGEGEDGRSDSEDSEVSSNEASDDWDQENHNAPLKTDSPVTKRRKASNTRKSK